MKIIFKLIKSSILGILLLTLFGPVINAKASTVTYQIGKGENHLKVNKFFLMLKHMKLNLI
ncbi:MAG: hypothetical protein ACRCUP_01095 [Mycoplasmatales bacterium]